MHDEIIGEDGVLTVSSGTALAKQRSTQNSVLATHSCVRPTTRQEGSCLQRQGGRRILFSISEDMYHGDKSSK